MVLGDAVSKLETFVWILNHNFHNLVNVHPKNINVDPKNIKLGQMTKLDMIFYVMVPDYRLIKI